MSIVAYSGLPGSGKSYGVVENVILPACEEGRPVYTNIPLNVDLIRDRYPMTDVRRLNVKALQDHPEMYRFFEPGSVVCIDEAWRLYPAGTKSTNMDEALKEFFTEHRHNVSPLTGLTTEIVLVTQDLSQLCAFVRTLIEETFHANKLSAVGLSKAYRLDIYGGAVTGQSPPASKLLRTLNGTYQEKIYRYYKSHTKSKKVGKEVKQDTRGNLLKRPAVMIGVPFMLVALPAGVFGVMNFFTTFGQPAVAAPLQPVPVARLAAVQVPPAPVDQVERAPELVRVKPTSISPRYSIEWRLAGTAVMADGTGRAVLRSFYGQRVVDLHQFCELMEGTPDYVCTVDGERITRFTGNVRSQPILNAGVNRAAETLGVPVGGERSEPADPETPAKTKPETVIYAPVAGVVK